MLLFFASKESNFFNGESLVSDRYNYFDTKAGVRALARTVVLQGGLMIALIGYPNLQLARVSLHYAWKLGHWAYTTCKNSHQT